MSAKTNKTILGIVYWKIRDLGKCRRRMEYVVSSSFLFGADLVLVGVRLFHFYDRQMATYVVHLAGF